MYKIDVQRKLGVSEKQLNRAILKAIERMNKELSCKCYMDGRLYIKTTGVKWLDQKYYRKSYIKELLDYKQKLNKKENKND